MPAWARGRSLVFALVLSSLATAKPEAGSYAWFRSQVKSPVCRARLEKMEEFRQLFALPSFRGALVTGDGEPLIDALQGWSSDLLVKIVLSVEQDYLVVCPEHKKAEAVLHPLRRAYLAQLGLPENRYTEADARRLYRALVVLKDEVPVLRQRLIAVREKPVEELVAGAFGGASDVRGVWLLSRDKRHAAALEEALAEACRNLAACPFWDERLLYKTMVTGERGVAAYLPELAVLILSRELLDDRNPLHRLVLLHELAHVAERGAWVLQRKDWKTAFAALSGWSQDKSGQWTVKTRQPASARADELTALSRGSAFSILPDAIYLGEAGEKGEKDGFVLGKSYEESLKRNDPSEDLADHVAAFVVAPERFCFEGKVIAPKKFAWVAKNVFGRAAKPPDCSQPASAPSPAPASAPASAPAGDAKSG